MRVFVAINFNHEFKNNLEYAQQILKKQDLSCVLAPKDNFHLTVAFIGDVEESDISRIEAAIERAKCSQFKIKSTEYGFFPGPKVVWLGCDGGMELRDLVENVRNELTNEGISFDSRPFKPHITIAKNARFGRSFALSKLKVNEFEMTVQSVDIMLSEIGTNGVEYTKLSQILLD